MKITEQTEKKFSLKSRANAVQCVIDHLAMEDIVKVWFTDQFWVVEGQEDKYEVTVTWRSETRD
jgi:hypothetical protein